MYHKCNNDRKTKCMFFVKNDFITQFHTSALAQESMGHNGVQKVSELCTFFFSWNSILTNFVEIFLQIFFTIVVERKKFCIPLYSLTKNSPFVIIFLKEFLMESFCWKCHFLFLEILNQKENGFEVRIQRKGNKPRVARQHCYKKKAASVGQNGRLSDWWIGR